MNQALRLTLISPEQATRAVSAQLVPFCREKWNQGERVSIVAQAEEDALSDRQRRYYHGVVLAEIAEQARANGQKFPMPVWKEYFRDKYLGFKVKTFVNPLTGKKARRRVRVSSEDLSVRKYSELIEQVTAFAATELGVEFSLRQEEFR